MCGNLIARAESLRRRNSVLSTAVTLDASVREVARVGQNILAVIGVGLTLGVERILHHSGGGGEGPGVHTASAERSSGDSAHILAELTSRSNDSVKRSGGGNSLQGGKVAGLGHFGAGGIAGLAGITHDPFSGNGANHGAQDNNNFVHDGHTIQLLEKNSVI